MPRVNHFAHRPRARGGRRCRRRELGGRVQQHPGSTTAFDGPGWNRFRTPSTRARGATLSAARARRSCSTAPRFDNGIDGSTPCSGSDISSWTFYPVVRRGRAALAPPGRLARAGCWPTSRIEPPVRTRAPQPQLRALVDGVGAIGAAGPTHSPTRHSATLVWLPDGGH